MSTVAIKIDGVDITADVFIEDAVFNTQVNGSLGLAEFRVKDDAQIYDFTAGGSLTLDVDGDRLWGGYVMQAKKSYPLPVLVTTFPTTVPRVWTIVGTDYNILFTKRIVFKESDPAGKIDFSYDADTYDDTIINDIFDNYLDIGSDGLTRTGVQRIAKAILDVPGEEHSGEVASAGFTWKEMMDSVQRATGGVYYIDPEKDLKYVDVETSTSVYNLTDTPSGGNDVGYQSFSILENGSHLVNDMLVWGAGTGTPNIVFSRTEDATSIADHGRWQLSQFTSSLFRQVSADIVADSYVYGTPQSHRGGKDDAVSFSARVFRPVFRAGEVVDVETGIFGFSDALPIRQMKITFANQTTPLFDLVLSHDIDQPVGIAEFRPFIAEKFKPRRIPKFKVPPHVLPPKPGGCECGITDTFTREIGPSTGGTGPFWGTSDSGLVWEVGVEAFAFGGYAEVTGGEAHLHLPGGSGQNSSGYLQAVGGLPDITVTARTVGATGEDTFYLVTDTTVANGVEVDLYADGQLFLYTPTDDASTTLGFGSETPFKLRLVASSDTILDVYVWEVGDPQPGTPTLSLTNSEPLPAAFNRVGLGFANEFNGSVWTTFDGYVSDIDISGVDRCSATQFENFNRVLTNALGVTTDGHAWDYTYGGDNEGDNAMDGNNLILRHFNSNPFANLSGEIFAQIPTPDGPWVSGYFTMTARMKVSPLPDSDPGVDHVAYYFELFDGSNVASIEVDVADAAVPGGGANRPTITLVEGGNDEVVDIAQVAETVFTDDGWFLLEWSRMTGTSELRVWQEGQTRPSSALLSVANSPFNPTEFTFIMDNFDLDPTTPDIYQYIDYIDFDYDGRPCYLDCSGITDTFTRTVSGGWGTSDAGLAWLTSGTRSVDGSRGLLAVGSFAALDGLAVTPAFEGTFEFQLSDLSGGTQLQVFFTEDNGNGDEVCDFYIAGSPFTDNVKVVRAPDSYFGSSDTGGFTLTTGVIHVRIQVDDAGGRIRLWNDGDTEPGTWTAESTTGSPTAFDATPIEMFLRNNVGLGTTYIDSLNVVGVNACSGVDPTAGSSSVPSTGHVCETIVHSGGTDFATARAFFSGSLQIWVNGLRSGANTTTPSFGHFTLTDSLDTTDVLYVCYQANGDPLT